MNNIIKTISGAYQKAHDAFFLAATVEGKSQRTLSLYEYALASVETFLEDKNPLEATTDDIRRYLLCQEGQKSKATIATYLKELHVFYNFAANEGFINENPATGIKPPRLPRAYPYVLSEADVEAMLKAIKGKTFEAKRNYALLLFFLDTGVRVSEAVGLTLEDINLTTYTARVNGKTGERVVHFGKVAAKALSAYLRARGSIAHEDSFFVSSVGNAISRHGVLRMIGRLGEKAGITGKRVSPHTLRHTAATFWIKNGGDTVSLRRQLGHVDHRMIDVYVNLVGRDLAEAHGKYSPLKRVTIK